MPKHVIALVCLFAVCTGALSAADADVLPEAAGMNSPELFNVLQKEGFFPEAESLVGSSSLLFPYNIHLTFGPETEGTLIYAVPIEDVRAGSADGGYDGFPGLVLDFAKYLKTAPLEMRTKIVFTANNVSSLPAYTADGMPAGIRTLADALDPTLPLGVILLRSAPSGARKAVVTGGTSERAVPAWLMKTIIVSMNDAGLAYRRETNMLSLYRLGWIPESPLLAALFDADIPAAEVLIPGGNSYLAFLEESARTAPREIRTEWDEHYFFINIGSLSLFPGENIIITAIVVVSGIVLLIFFCFSFIFGEKQEQYRQDFKRTWYFIPFILLITAASLYLAQMGTSWLFSFIYGSPQGWQMRPYSALALKFVGGLAILAAITIVQRFFRFPEDDYIYGFMVNLISLANIFIFSIMDFSLTILFALEYVLALIFSKTRRTAPLIISAAAMFIPFGIYFFEALYAGGIGTLNVLFAGSPAQNVALSLIFVPFELVFIRLMVRAQRFGKRELFYLPGFAIAFSSAAVILTAAAFIVPPFSSERPLETDIEQTFSYSPSAASNTAAVYRPFPDGSEIVLTREGQPFGDTLPAELLVNAVLPDSGKQLSVKTSQSVFLDRKRITLEITSRIPGERIDVEVERSSGYAVFDANFPFTTDSGGRICRFTLDEHPPVPLVIEFTTEQDADITVTVMLYSNENPQGISAESLKQNVPMVTEFLYREKQELQFAGSPVRGAKK